MKRTSLKWLAAVIGGIACCVGIGWILWRWLAGSVPTPCVRVPTRDLCAPREQGFTYGGLLMQDQHEEPTQVIAARGYGLSRSSPDGSWRDVALPRLASIKTTFRADNDLLVLAHSQPDIYTVPTLIGSRDGCRSWQEPRLPDGWRHAVFGGDVALVLTETSTAGRLQSLCSTMDGGVTWRTVPLTQVGVEAERIPLQNWAMAVSRQGHMACVTVVEEAGTLDRDRYPTSIRMAYAGDDPRHGEPIREWPVKDHIRQLRLEACASGFWLVGLTTRNVQALWIGHDGNRGRLHQLARSAEFPLSTFACPERCLVAWLDNSESWGTKFGPIGARFRSLHVRPLWRTLPDRDGEPGPVYGPDGEAAACTAPALRVTPDACTVMWWTCAVSIDGMNPDVTKPLRIRIATTQ